MQIKKKIILTLFATVILSISGCNGSSKKNMPNNSNLFSNKESGRVDFYGKYEKDSFPISKPIPYLKVVNDLKEEKNVFKNKREGDFLNFYKNTKIRGYGDQSNYWRWYFSLSKNEIEKILNVNLFNLSLNRPKEILTYSDGKWISKKLSSNPVGEIKELKIVQRGESGIAIKLLISGSNGKYIVAKEGNIRNVLGLSKNIVESEVELFGAKGGNEKYGNKALAKNPKILPSGFLAFEKNSKGGYDFYGGGFGHGSGIPQWTAMDLTKNKGYTYKKIIERYYQGTKIKNINTIDGMRKNIRVGIMTSEFKSSDHSKVTMFSQGTIKVQSKSGNVTIKPNSKLEIIALNDYMVISVDGKTKLKTKSNISISSNKMISLTNIKRNIKNQKYPTYRGKFEIRQSKAKNKFKLINDVLLEDYLLQVVPSEMPKYFGLEALKVQAIAARTYAAKDILKKGYKDSGFDILDSTQSQVYNNLDENDIATEAVRSTKNLIIVHENKPIDAKYYSTSSGFNSSAHDTW